MTGNELLEELRRASRSKKIPTAEKINLVLAALADVHAKQIDLERQNGCLSEQIGQESSKTREWVNGLKKDADETHAALDKRIIAVEHQASLYNRLHGAVSGALLALQTYLAAMR